MSSIYVRPPTANQKIYVIGDVHGDLGLLLCLLHDCADVVGSDLCWRPGENAWVVFLGDMVDRFRPGMQNQPKSEMQHEEVLIQLYLNKLDAQAREHGGRIFKIIGNHELMNVTGDYTYATNAGRMSRQRFPLTRGSAFAKAIATDNSYIVLQIGAWLFMHAGIGGLTRRNLHKLKGINHAAHELFRSRGAFRDPNITAFLMEEHGPAWDRSFGFGCRSRLLTSKFKLVEEITKHKVHRMAIGHTIQEINDEPALVFPPATRRLSGGRSGRHPIPYTRDLLRPIYKQTMRLDPSSGPRVEHLEGRPLVTKNGPKGICSGCGERVWRMDVGMSRAFGMDLPDHRLPQILEVRANGKVVRLRNLRRNVWKYRDRVGACLPPWISLSALNYMLFEKPWP